MGDTPGGHASLFVLSLVLHKKEVYEGNWGLEAPRGAARVRVGGRGRSGPRAGGREHGGPPPGGWAGAAAAPASCRWRRCGQLVRARARARAFASSPHTPRCVAGGVGGGASAEKRALPCAPTVGRGGRGYAAAAAAAAIDTEEATWNGVKRRAGALEERVAAALRVIDPELRRAELGELEERAGSVNIWDDRDEAQVQRLAHTHPRTPRARARPHTPPPAEDNGGHQHTERGD